MHKAQQPGSAELRAAVHRQLRAEKAEAVEASGLRQDIILKLREEAANSEEPAK